MKSTPSTRSLSSLHSDFSGNMGAWENGVNLHDSTEPLPAVPSVKAHSRWAKLKPHLIHVARSAVGTALASTLVFLPGISNVMTGTARFFAVIVPFLALGHTVGATFRNLAGLPLIIAALVFGTLIVSALDRSMGAMHSFLASAGVFAFQWGAVSASGLTKKLAAGVYCSVVLEHVFHSLPFKSTWETGLALTYGLLLGYGAAAFAALFPVPQLAVVQLRARVAKVSRLLAKLLLTIMSDLKSSTPDSPHYEELVASYFSKVDHIIAELPALALECEAEVLGVRSFDPVVEHYCKLFAAARTHLKGFYLGLRNRIALPPDYEAYSTLRDTIENSELALGECVVEYLEALALTVGDDHFERTLEPLRSAAQDEYSRLQGRVASARASVWHAENNRKRGIPLWSEEVVGDMLTSYFSLSGVSELHLVLQRSGFHVPLSEWSVQPLIRAFGARVLAWTPSDAKHANVARLFNGLVISLSVAVASLFVVVPSVAAIFPSGVSAAVTAIFVFTEGSFGTNITSGKNRITGIVIGGTFGYVTLLLGGAVTPGVTTTILMTAYVVLATLIIAFDNQSIANASVFSVALTLYAAGGPSTSLDNFQTVSNYFVANALGAVILVSWGAIFWFLTLWTRPDVFRELAALSSDLAHHLERVLSRAIKLDLDDASMESVPDFSSQLALLNRYVVDIPLEPSLGSVMPSIEALTKELEVMRASGMLLHHLDTLTRTIVSDNGFVSLRETGVLPPGVAVSLHSLVLLLETTLARDVPSMLRLEVGSSRVISWHSEEVLLKAAEFSSTAAKAFPSAFSNPQYVLAGRPMVRWVSVIFSVVQFSRLVARAFDLTIELSASTRKVVVDTSRVAH